MNAIDILKYGHQTVLKSLDGLPEPQWETGGVVGLWSVKNIIGHLASFEHILVEVLDSFLDKGPTPYLDEYRNNPKFNDMEVAKRSELMPAQVFEEYNEVQAQTMQMIERIPVELRRKPGMLAWYGNDYDLEDFIVYTFYGHKREHSAQIALFKKKLQR